AQPNDPGLLGTMLERTRQLLGHALRALLADTAYAGGADLAAAAALGVAIYAPLPEDGKKADKQIPKSAFVWQAVDKTYLCPTSRRLEYAGTSQQKRSGPETVHL